MLLKKLKVTNSRGSSMELELEDVSSGYIVKDIQGLGPVKTTLVSSSFANIDGAQYHSSRREPRNIIIKLGLDPDYASGSVYELRSRLYDFFLTKAQVLLEFNLFDRFSDSVIDQNFKVQIKARIESVEPDIFSKDPSLDISLMCFHPDFVRPDAIKFNGFTVNNLDETPIEYTGTADTGVLLVLKLNRTVTEFVVYHRTPDDMLKTLYFNYILGDGDTVEINSVRGNKYAKLIRYGVEKQILYAIEQQSSWLEMSKGVNQLRIYAEGLPVPYELEYFNRYGGL